MADDTTKFRFDFGGIQLELSGEREFVERMYQRVMKDVEEARRRREAAAKPEAKKETEKAPSVWVHCCSDMMRKVYMASQRDVGNSPLVHAVDITALNNLYMDRDVFRHFFPNLEGGHTLWAEFTAIGRQKIAEATSPKRKALQSPDSKS